MSRPTISVTITQEQFVWFKDHPEQNRSEHVRDAIALYIAQYDGMGVEEVARVIGPDTKVTISTPDGPKPYRLKVKPAEYDFTPAEPKEIDPSTGQPIE